MIELNTEEGTKLEIYDPSCIVSMRELYGGYKGEYTSLMLAGLTCSVTVLETKGQIERMLKLEREQAKDREDYTNRVYRYTNKIVYKKKDARYREDLEYIEYVIVTATKNGKVTAIDQNGREIDIAETYKVERELQQAGKTVGLEENFFVKAVGMGRYWR
ncbi:hypothetical protein [Granulicatella adiacens]|uniref:hypothetical protein n=1 Tax=Granulicatella adiacens TaxID=46124 RepID=UPI003C6F3DEC